MSPVLAEIVMKRWEEEKIDKEKKIRKFGRYIDDSLGIWKGNKMEFEEKMKKIRGQKKRIKLKLEVENKSKIAFLDIKLVKNEESGKVKT